MQLTPRNLVMACGAMVAGGAVFGVVTTLAPAVSLPTATAANPTPTATTWTTPASGELGDEEITFPASPSAAPAVAPSAWPTPVSSSTGPASTPSPAATDAVRSPSASPSATGTPNEQDHARPSATPAASTSQTPRASRSGSGQAARGARAPRPTATPTPTRRTAPAPTASPRRTIATGGWQAPNLGVGANTIAVPRLTSRAPVRVMVGCSPSSACQISGDQLVIDSSATAVTVTWWAPAARGYRAWQVSRAL